MTNHPGWHGVPLPPQCMPDRFFSKGVKVLVAVVASLTFREDQDTCRLGWSPSLFLWPLQLLWHWCHRGVSTGDLWQIFDRPAESSPPSAEAASSTAVCLSGNFRFSLWGLSQYAGLLQVWQFYFSRFKKNQTSVKIQVSERRKVVRIKMSWLTPGVI